MARKSNQATKAVADSSDEEEMEFEEVAAPSSSAPRTAAQSVSEPADEDEDAEMEEVGDEDEDGEMEEVGTAEDEGADDDEEDDEEEDAAAYADLYDGEDAGAGPSTSGKGKQAATKKGKPKSAKDSGSAPRIYFDGKGQHAGVTISLDDASSMQRKRKREADAEAEAKRKRREKMITPRDRQNRIVAHKLHVLALLAWARQRNAMLQDDELQAWLADQVPQALIEKQKRITPRKEPNQRERVRLFEAFLTQLTEWWKGHFKLDATMCAGAAIRQPDTDLVNGSGLTWARPGRRVDGWVYESAAQRVDRQKAEREALRQWQEKHAAAAADAEGSGTGAAKGKKDPKGKGKAKEVERKKVRVKTAPPPVKTPEISIFPPGQPSHTKLPAYLRLAEPVERIRNSRDLLEAAIEQRGSRETSASLFASLCRALGIPARLVISPQVAPWSVAAAKVATTGGEAVGAGSTSTATMMNNSTMRKPGSERLVKVPSDVATSDEEAGSSARRRGLTPLEDVGGSGSGKRKAPAPLPLLGSTKKNGVKGKGKAAATTPSSADAARSISVVSVTSSRASSADVVEGAAPSSKSKGKARAKPNGSSAPSRRKDKGDDDAITVLSDSSAASVARATKVKPAAQEKGAATTPAKGKGKRKGKGKGKDDEEEDYRDEKWKGLKAPLEVSPTIKLRPHSRRKMSNGQTIQDVDGELEPVNLQYPPTVWVEVFSKPFQKWLTVDPIRGFVFATGNRYMEPVATDRQNKLVYVVAYEEDGYARDVTPRYTRTLNSRIARMRPPPSKTHGDWWASVVRAISRPFKLDRDAVEDVELEDNAAKEPMPTSVGGFKDHPVYAIEKHLKRDEVIFPPTRVGTFQKMPVYLRSNVLTCRSARQWMNEGRSIKPDEQPLKLVKARAYTIGNKRAEEQAKAQGQEGPQEGLYARSQTQIYRPPPVVDGKIPTNSFGNIDLYVPSMLPEGAAHIPYNGSAKVAKKLGISYAEAVIGFEFKKFRGMPKMGGIVVPKEHEETVLEAFWASEEAAVEKEEKRKQERALKNWRKLINAVKIAERVKAEYGGKSSKKGASNKKEVSRLRAIDDEDGGDASADAEPGGFIVDDEEQAPGGFLPDDDEDAAMEEAPSRPSVLPSKYGGARTANGHQHDADVSDSDDALTEEDLDEDGDSAKEEVVAQPSSSKKGKIVSIQEMISSEHGTAADANVASDPAPSRRSARKRASSPAAAPQEGRTKRIRVTRSQPTKPASQETPASSGTRRSSRRSQAAAQNAEKLKDLKRAEKELDSLIDDLE